MATRQYVGARYVPKFAEPIGWVKENSYEALTIVTYLNNSYTSKKPVPPNTDITNEEYWVVTGNYNAQVEQYRQETINYIEQVEQYREETNNRIEQYREETNNYIEQCREETNNLSEKIDILEESVNNGYKHNIIYIGDSYAEGYTPDGSVAPWTTYCNSVLGSSLGEFYISALGGAGFLGDQYGRATFLSLLKKLEGTISDKESITDILVAGCVNDLNGNASTIPTYLEAFSTYAKATYPKAKLWIAPVGRTTRVSDINKLKTFLTYWSASVIYGFNYINRSNLILHFENYFSSDGLHPNASGQRAIGSYLGTALLGGGISIFNTDVTTFSSDTVTIGDNTIEVYFDNEVINVLKSNNSVYVLNTPTSMTFGRDFQLALGKINTGCIKANTIDEVTINVRVLSAGENKFYEAPMSLCMHENNLVIRGSILDSTNANYLTTTVSEIHIGRFTLKLDAYNC